MKTNLLTMVAVAISLSATIAVAGPGDVGSVEQTLVCRQEQLNASGNTAISEIKLNTDMNFNEYVCGQSYDAEKPTFLKGIKADTARNCLVLGIRAEQKSKKISITVMKQSGLDLIKDAFAFEAKGQNKVSLLLGLPDSFKDGSVTAPTEIVCEFK